ncbi:Uncharacterised protein, partial [Mycoplasma putrefaciens]
MQKDLDLNKIDNDAKKTTSSQKQKISKETKKKLKIKKHKEPKNFKLMLKEFPIKMVKEISKIRW